VAEERASFFFGDKLRAARSRMRRVLRTPISVRPILGQRSVYVIGVIYPGNEAFGEGSPLDEPDTVVLGTAKPSKDVFGSCHVAAGGVLEVAG
jgi:hypothetical protein